jgi:hypothetical protein
MLEARTKTQFLFRSSNPAYERNPGAGPQRHEGTEEKISILLLFVMVCVLVSSWHDFSAASLGLLRRRGGLLHKTKAGDLCDLLERVLNKGMIIPRRSRTDRLGLSLANDAAHAWYLTDEGTLQTEPGRYGKTNDMKMNSWKKFAAQAAVQSNDPGFTDATTGADKNHELQP